MPPAYLLGRRRHILARQTTQANFEQNKIDFGGSLTPYSTWMTHAIRAGLYYYPIICGVFAATSSINPNGYDFSFFPKFPPFLSSFVVHLSCIITPYTTISYYIAIVGPYRRRTYTHTYIPWDVIHSTLGHYSLSHPFFNVCLLIFYLLFLPVSTTSICIYNIHPYSIYSSPQPTRFDKSCLSCNYLLLSVSVFRFSIHLK